MNTAAAKPEYATDSIEETAVRRAFRRLMPLLMLFYILAYVDRINIGFANLTMGPELGLTAAMFGFANTAFYIMFSAFEVPSNMMLAKYGARVWIPRIMITWGIASIATMFAVGPYSLYGLRSLVGLAEAGLLPGIIYYMGYWFPQQHRAKANAIFLAALPAALMIGSPLSAIILQMDGLLGIAGWRWLFILEGIPSVLVGIAVYFVLPNRPKDATWLTDAQKTALQARLDKEHAKSGPPSVKKAGVKLTAWQEVFSTSLVALAVSYFCIIATANTLGIWIPQIVRELLGNTNNFLLVGVLSAVPPGVAIVAMQFVSRNSDRMKERTWHTVASMTLCASGWVITASSDFAVGKMIGLSVCSVGAYSAMCTFWAMTSQFLSRKSQAIGIAFISSIGTIASIVSPTIVGILRDMTASFNTSIWYAAGLLMFGVVLMLTVAVPRQRAAAQS